MKKKISCFSVCVVAAAVMMLIGGEMTEAVVCSPVELNSCMPAITMSIAPSTTCCLKTREQRPCFCQYLRDPNLKHFFSYIGDRKVADACGLPYPVC